MQPNINPSYQNSNPQFIPYSSPAPLKLPPIPTLKQTYTSSNIQFKEAYDNCGLLSKMVQNRYSKILQRKKRMHLYKQYSNYNNPYIIKEAQLRNFSNARGQLYHPQSYYGQLMEPLYYPLEMPVSGEPIALPNIEVGQPSDKGGKSHFNFHDLAAIMEVVDNWDAEPNFENPNVIKEKVKRLTNVYDPREHINQELLDKMNALMKKLGIKKHPDDGSKNFMKLLRELLDKVEKNTFGKKKENVKEKKENGDGNEENQNLNENENKNENENGNENAKENANENANENVPYNSNVIKTNQSN